MVDLNMSDRAQHAGTAGTRLVTMLESDLPKMILSGSLSKRTTYTFRADGPFGAREAKAALSMLSAQIEILDFETEDVEAQLSSMVQSLDARCAELEAENERLHKEKCEWAGG